MRKLVLAVAAVSLIAATATPAFAQYGAKPAPKAATPELPRCARPLGTVAIQEPQQRWWERYGLGNPDRLLKLYASRSGCLRVVDRGAGLEMRSTERDLAGSGELQRGSNIGRGQVVAADYFIIPDLANADEDTGGNAVGGLVGGLVGGQAGALIGGIKTKRLEAQALITLVDARTTEQLYVAEGTAQKTDLSWAGGGGVLGSTGLAALAGGGYADTEIGKIISAAYFNAYVDLVTHLQSGAVPTGAEASANAGQAAQVLTANVAVREAPSPNARVLYTAKQGSLVYPTGARNGVWMEVDDENGNRGWISSAFATPR
ncbi:MAG TPA: CsgG/HfaB family protein [Caulobacter sp.]|nr:CsgG/HfaB family protein [Caulobacter sp.]